MDYHVRLQFYEGPLALLVHLIESQELDIWNIPIAHITEQYLGYLANMEELNLEVGGEFLLMAATLLAIKARMLLPPDPNDDDELAVALEEEEDPRDELVRRLIEYRQFREAGRALAERLQARGVVAGRGSPPPPGTIRYINPIGRAVVGDLLRAYQQVLESDAEPETAFRLPTGNISLEDRVDQVLRAVRNSGLVRFESLCKRRDRRFVVVTFLAVLELIRQGVASAAQNDTFGPILIGEPDNTDNDPAPDITKEPGI